MFIMLRIYYYHLLICFLSRPVEEFINRFEKLKTRLGTDFVDKLGEDSSLIEIMYDN